MAIELYGASILYKKINNKYYKEGLCPVAENIQPQIVQLKTNFGSTKEVLKQVKALKKTIKNLNKGNVN